jgi:hypothetical protein
LPSGRRETARNDSLRLKGTKFRSNFIILLLQQGIIRFHCKPLLKEQERPCVFAKEGNLLAMDDSGGYRSLFVRKLGRKVLDIEVKRNGKSP